MYKIGTLQQLCVCVIPLYILEYLYTHSNAKAKDKLKKVLNYFLFYITKINFWKLFYIINILLSYYHIVNSTIISFTIYYYANKYSAKYAQCILAHRIDM